MNRLRFCIVAVHAIIQSGEPLDGAALEGLKEILENIVLEGVNDNR